MKTVQEQVIESLRLYLLLVDPSKITPEATWDDLECDSLDRIEIVMNMEDEFGLEIPDEDAEKWVKVQDVIDYIALKTTAVTDAPAP